MQDMEGYAWETGKTETIMRKCSYKTSDPKFKMLKREDNANRQHKGH